jgi:uncharacterized protein (DUF58 family)
MREALSGLTTRGRAFVAAGAAALLCAIVLGQDALVRVGALLLLLPFLTAFLLGRSRYRLGLVRTLTPTHVTAGQQAVVQLDLTNDGTMPTGLLLLEDRVPHALGTGPRFVIDRMGLGWHRTVDYPVSCEVRGTFTVGPMRVSLKDPFGLVELERTFTSTSPLVVTPRVVPLPVVPLSGVWTGAGDNRPHSFAHGSAEDVTVREYRRGDDLRRVHWRSSAHAGELMVRREEQPWQSRATLFIDDRASSHRGPGAASSFEHAVTAAASIAVHLVQRGFTVRLVTARSDARSGSWHEHRATAAETGPLLESLAVLTETTDQRIDTGWLADSAPSGLLITVLGAVADRDTAALSRMRHSASTAMALVLDVPAWANGGTPPAGSSAGSSAGSRTVPQVEWLGAHGWRTAVAGPADPLAGVWQELGSARRRPSGSVLATPADRTFERPSTGTP